MVSLPCRREGLRRAFDFSARPTALVAGQVEAAKVVDQPGLQALERRRAPTPHQSSVEPMFFLQESVSSRLSYECVA